MLKILFLVLAALSVRQVPTTPERARDPWVFRCVLDQHPRMVVFALSKDLWCAYDAQTCTFAKAWKGRAKLQGAVYDAEHGPQPVADGPEYAHGFAEQGWEVQVDGVPVRAEIAWGGYWFHDQVCTLLYEVKLPDGRRFQVRETPEFIRPESLFADEQITDFGLQKGDPGLMRSFYAAELPAGVKVCIRISFAGANGKLVEAIEREDAGKQEGWVVLTAQKFVNNALLFWKAPAAAPAQEAK